MEPIAWLFKNPERVRLWATAHEGEVVPLHERAAE